MIYPPEFWRIRKIVRVMKISVLFSIIFTLSVTAGSYAQDKKMNISLKNASLQEIFDEISEQSEFYIFYEHSKDQLGTKQSVNIKESTVGDILDRVLKHSELTYKVVDKYIAIVPKELQQKGVTIVGKVIDRTGMSLPGVSVMETGTENGVTTNEDGKYSINVEGNSLTFTFIGMKTKTVEIAGRKIVDVILESDMTDLDEVVVVGYGTQKKSNLTGAVSSVNFDKKAMASRPLTNVSSALSGLSSGMFVVQNSGNPSSDGATIKIRGTGSLSASQAPLILVDGVPGDINSLNPQNIASVSVLKDAASAAIYGSRASNGVVLITTKTGSNTNGKVTFEYNGNVSYNSPTRLFDFVTNTADHMEIINQIKENSGLTPAYTNEFINEWRQGSETDPLKYPNTDWWDEIIKMNKTQTHTISARGGNKRMSFFNSLGILKNDGIIDNTGFTRVNFKSNLLYKVNDWLEIGNLLSARLAESDPNNVDGVLGYLQATTPGMVPKHPDGRYGAAQTQGGETQANNAIYGLETTRGENLKQEYDAKFFTNITPLKGLKFTASYFIYKQNYNKKSYSNPQARWDFMNDIIVMDVPNSVGISEYNKRKTREVVDLIANYEKSIGSHKFKALVGYNQEEYKEEWYGASKRDLISQDTPVLDAAPNVPNAYGSAYDYALQSYFGRINYDYMGKYLFEANLRIDGSSRFHEDKRWGKFPSFSAGWRVSEESFFQDLKEKVNNLKIRGSWGHLGNNNIKSGSAGQYVWQNVYTPNNYGIGESITQGLTRNAIANQDLTWEETEILNIGVDFSLFNKVNVTFDYYDKYTDGILASLPIPLANGGLTAPYINSAAVRNTGYELNVDYTTKINDVEITANLNGSYNKNEIEKYKGDLYEPHGAGVWTEGQPIGKYWLREVDHIIQDQAEVDKLVADGYTWNGATPGPGDFLYKDANGDKRFDNDDRILMGNPVPKFTYGGSLNIAYKGFDFYTLFNGVSGWDKYLKPHLFSNKLRTDGYMFITDVQDMWTTENRNTSVPKIYTNDSRNDQASDYFLHDASYFRIKTLQLGYTLPKQLVERAGLQSLRIYINAENYFTFTNDYPGLDPENNKAVTYPLIKSFSIGMNIKL